MPLWHSFNSKLVRLKVTNDFTELPAKKEFQFQTGSIKRSKKVLYVCDEGMFQFQTGSIKRAIQPTVLPLLSWFQFQTGSIKSICGRLRTILFPCFNSKLVRLKV